MRAGMSPHSMLVSGVQEWVMQHFLSYKDRGPIGSVNAPESARAAYVSSFETKESSILHY